jgi:hypothetical protein
MVISLMRHHTVLIAIIGTHIDINAAVGFYIKWLHYPDFSQGRQMDVATLEQQMVDIAARMVVQQADYLDPRRAMQLVLYAPKLPGVLQDLPRMCTWCSTEYVEENMQRHVQEAFDAASRYARGGAI